MAEVVNDPLQCDLLDVGCHFSTFTEWLGSFFPWLWQQIATAIGAVLSAIPVPDWADNMSSFQIPEGVMWVASAMELQYGATVMASAYFIRFLIRRIPIIG